MTDRHDRLRYYGGVHGEERLLREDLRGFHMCVSAEDALDSEPTKRWRAISSLQLQQAGVDLTAEAAWALLARWEGVSTSDGVELDDAALRVLVRGLLATLPPLVTWLRHVDRFPSGEAAADFRRHRRETILRWFPHVHPDSSLLAEYVRNDPALPALVRAGVSAHIQGPYNCFACRSAVRKLSAASQRPDASQRLVAAAAEQPHKYETNVEVRGATYPFGVSFLEDGSFFRVFASSEGGRTPPRIEMKLVVMFRTSPPREGTIVYPDHGMTGANLGPLRGLRVDDMASFALEP